ncbi:unnamed protein product, partial [Ectocarpus sp. 12 AP-2014]
PDSRSDVFKNAGNFSDPARRQHQQRQLAAASSSSFGRFPDHHNSGAPPKRQGPPIASKDDKVPKLRKEATPRRKVVRKPTRRPPEAAAAAAGAKGLGLGPGWAKSGPPPGAGATVGSLGAREGQQARLGGDTGARGQYPSDSADPRFGRDFSAVGGPDYHARGPPAPPPPAGTFPFNRIGSDGVMGAAQLRNLPPPMSMMERVVALRPRPGARGAAAASQAR